MENRPWLVADIPDGAMDDDFFMESAVERDELWPAPVQRECAMDAADEAVFVILSRAVSPFCWRRNSRDQHRPFGQQARRFGQYGHGDWRYRRRRRCAAVDLHHHPAPRVDILQQIFPSGRWWPAVAHAGI